MHELVGAGGWGYFEVGGADSLVAYAHAFPFVEANMTFYRHPETRTSAAWRRRVPDSFEFSIRAHREVTHRSGFRATAAARSSLARTASLAAKLDAVAIVLETPATIRPDPAEVEDLVSAAKLETTIALEARAFHGRELPTRLASVMEANDIADVVDFSRQTPRTTSSLAYGRMFGLGERNQWEFTDEELAAVRDNGERGDHVRVAYTFHGVRMYKDAGRFLTYLRTGKFPRPTRQEGLGSLEEVLEDAATFPTRKTDLIRDHGFRVVNLATGSVHAAQILDRLPAGQFGSAREVVAALTGNLGPRVTPSGEQGMSRSS